MGRRSRPLTGGGVEMRGMNLGCVLKQWRWAEKLTTRDAALWIGIKNSTYSRIERGYPMDGKTLATIITWLLERERKSGEPKEPQ